MSFLLNAKIFKQSQQNPQFLCVVQIMYLIQHLLRIVEDREREAAALQKLIYSLTAEVKAWTARNTVNAYGICWFYLYNE